MRLMVAMVVTFMSSAAWSQTKIERFKSGPLDGMGTHGEPSLPNASPVPETDRAAMATLQAAYQHGRPEEANGMLLNGAVLVDVDAAGDPKDRLSSDRILRRQVNAPYAVNDLHGSVRLEWVSDGKVYYVSWIRLEGGKIASMTRMSETPMPVVVN